MQGHPACSREINFGGQTGFLALEPKRVERGSHLRETYGEGVYPGEWSWNWDPQGHQQGQPGAKRLPRLGRCQNILLPLQMLKCTRRVVSSG